MKLSRREKRERFNNWILGLCVGAWLFIITLAYGLQEQVDHYYGYDLRTLRPTDKLVTSFIESVHSSSPDRPKKEFVAEKWVMPVSISLNGEFSDWHRQIISEQALLLQKLTGLEIKIVDPVYHSASIKIFFVEGKDAILETGQKIMPHKSWNKIYVGQDRCFALIENNARKEIVKAINISAWTGRESSGRRCLIEELTQTLGPSNDNATYRPSIFSNHELPDRLSINDRILVRAFYDKRIKPGMTRKQTEPIARQIIEELVAAVKQRGEKALYQR